MKLFILGVLLTFSIFSCTESEVATNSLEESIVVEIETRSTDLGNFEQELFEFWNQGLSDYSLEIFCSCDCIGVNSVQNHMNQNFNMMPSLFPSYEQTNYSCETIHRFMSQGCGRTKEEYKQLILDIEPTSFFTKEEHSLIVSLMNDIETNSLIIEDYRESWYRLETSSTMNNAGSALLIELANASAVFLSGFDGTEDEEIEAIFNKIGGALIAGTASYLYDGFAAGSDGMTGSQAWSSFKKGFIIGGLTSL